MPEAFDKIPDLSASVRILELDLAAALQEVFDRKELPVEIKSTAPRAGGLCENVFKALAKRADAIDPGELFAQNTLTLFANEKKITFDTSVAGRDVFIVLDFPLPDSKKVSPEYFLLSRILGTDAYISLAQQAGQAAKLNGAAHVHLIMPNFAYARQDKDHKQRAPISASITAQNIEPYFDSVTSVHLHSPTIKGMFRAIPLHEIAAEEICAPAFVCRDAATFAPIAAADLTREGVNALFSQLCIVSPDAGGAKNARDFAKYCKTLAATLLNAKEDAIVDIPLAQIDKRRSGPNASEVMSVLGRENVAGRKAIIIDDMGDTFGTAAGAARALSDAGATGVEFWGTHGYFSGKALDRIAASKIERVNVTNSMAVRSAVAETPNIHITDIAPILAQVIVDLTTKAEPDMRFTSRHLETNDERRRILGRHVFAMIPKPGTA